jgi:hypothetical protein
MLVSVAPKVDLASLLVSSQVDSYVTNRDAALLQPPRNLGRVESLVTVLLYQIENELSLVWFHGSWCPRMGKEPDIVCDCLFTAIPENEEVEGTGVVRCACPSGEDSIWLV